MTFNPADPTSLCAFLLIDLAVITAVFVGVFKTFQKAGGDPLKPTALVGAGYLFWLVGISFVVDSGFIENSPMPRLPLFFFFVNLCAVVFALSPLGKKMSQALSIRSLVLFQAFRLPLELVLHEWAKLGTIPETMTWTGSNFDIVSGVVALVAAPLVGRTKAAAWIANVVGFVLLLNVGRVAMLSSPLPFGWGTQPPLQLAFHLPYVLIAPICVAGALAGHLILTRALVKR